MLQKISLYYYTIKFLKRTQIQYQLWYRLRSKWRSISKFKYNYQEAPSPFEKIKMVPSIQNHTSYLGNNHFTFLNKDYVFEKNIDWDYYHFGKLWSYNLNYFEFLHQENSITFQSEYSDIINDYIQNLPNLSNANEPFPTSLRIINWIKYFTKNQTQNSQWNASLYSQSLILSDNIEYHLLGNHLLENGFALTMAGIYFQDSNLYKKGRKILEDELQEQILKDGAHFELSPMYHSLMLYRLLDTINLLFSNIELVKNISQNQNTFLNHLQAKASSMVGWLKAISYDDGSYPHFNDSTDGIAPDARQLINYAESLGVFEIITSLSDSGYRRLKKEDFDIIFKTGNIGPDYIPGHAHADSLTFVCRVKNQPFIVDTAISTYEKNQQRQNERSTESHNTVIINRNNSSAVWGGFRVGKRAKSLIINETTNSISTTHNGYGDKVLRSIFLENKKVVVDDRIYSREGAAHFHFGENIHIVHQSANVILGNGVCIQFENSKNIHLESYQLAKGFNKTTSATKAIITFDSKLTTTFTFS